MGTVRLTMEIDTDTQPIRGRVHVAGDPATSEFIGWVQLVQTVERVRGAGLGTAKDPARPARIVAGDRRAPSTDLEDPTGPSAPPDHHDL